jgi:hypothetical protein
MNKDDAAHTANGLSGVRGAISLGRDGSLKYFPEAHRSVALKTPKIIDAPAHVGSVRVIVERGKVVDPRRFAEIATEARQAGVPIPPMAKAARIRELELSEEEKRVNRIP